MSSDSLVARRSVLMRRLAALDAWPSTVGFLSMAVVGVGYCYDGAKGEQPDLAKVIMTVNSTASSLTANFSMSNMEALEPRWITAEQPAQDLRVSGGEVYVPLKKLVKFYLPPTI
jgi:hypothetical protein